MSKDKTSLFNNKYANTVKSVNTVSKAVAITAKIAEAMEKGEQFLVNNNPYYAHMPKDDIYKAALYSAKMGGEDHDISGCTII